MKLGVTSMHLSTHDKQPFYRHLGYNDGPAKTGLRHNAKLIQNSLVCYVTINQTIFPQNHILPRLHNGIITYKLCRRNDQISTSLQLNIDAYPMTIYRKQGNLRVENIHEFNHHETFTHTHDKPIIIIMKLFPRNVKQVLFEKFFSHVTFPICGTRIDA